MACKAETSLAPHGKKELNLGREVKKKFLRMKFIAR